MNPDLFFDYIERATTELEARTEQCKRETASLVRGTHAGSTTLKPAGSSRIRVGIRVSQRVDSCQEIDESALLQVYRLLARTRDRNAAVLHKLSGNATSTASASSFASSSETNHSTSTLNTPPRQQKQPQPLQPQTRAAPGTPKLEDFGISASTLALVADLKPSAVPATAPSSASLQPSPSSSQSTATVAKPITAVAASAQPARSQAPLSYAQIAATPPKPKPAQPSMLPASAIPAFSLESQRTHPTSLPQSVSSAQQPVSKTKTSLGLSQATISLEPPKRVSQEQPKPRKSSQSSQSTQSSKRSTGSSERTSRPSGDKDSAPRRQPRASPTSSDSIVVLMDEVASTEKGKVLPASLWNNFDLPDVNKHIGKLNEYITNMCFEAMTTLDSIPEKDVGRICKLDEKRAKSLIMLLCKLRRFKLVKQDDKTVVYKITSGTL